MVRMANLWIVCTFLAIASIGRAGEQKETKPPAKEVPLKTVHLLNLPDGVTEAQVTAFIADLNRGVAAAGHPGSGYRLWKVQSSVILKNGGNEKTEYQYQYLWEGNWSSQADYDAIHKHDAYKAAAKPHLEAYKKLLPYLYIRYAEVPTEKTRAEAKDKAK